MKYCIYCGAAIENGQKFCINCGKSLQVTDSAPEESSNPDTDLFHEQNQVSDSHGHTVMFQNPAETDAEEFSQPPYYGGKNGQPPYYGESNGQPPYYGGQNGQPPYPGSPTENTSYPFPKNDYPPFPNPPYTDANEKEKRKNPVVFVLAGIAIVALLIALFLFLRSKGIFDKKNDSVMDEPGDRSSSTLDFHDLEEGQTVEFGYYPQTDMEEEEIVWEVLAVEDGKALLLSQSALTESPYHDAYEKVTWEDSYIREWLNNSFYTAAFTSEEQELILESTNTTRWYDDLGQSTIETSDYVFLLSLEEAEEILPADSMKCKTTEYANNQEYSYSNSDFKDYCYWWLRSPGFDSSMAAYIDENGAISYSGQLVDNPIRAIRPAIWVDTTK